MFIHAANAGWRTVPLFIQLIGSMGPDEPRMAAASQPARESLTERATPMLLPTGGSVPRSNRLQMHSLHAHVN